MNEIVKDAWLPLCAYLLGAVPFGLVLARRFAGIDLRQSGSGNIGATNVRRVAGNRLGAITLLADALKGALPVGLALYLTPSEGLPREILPIITLWAAFLGHLYPIYLKFKTGGKGVATAGGGLFMLSWQAGVIAVLIFLAIVGITRRISLGSLGAAALLPLIIWHATGSLPAALAMAPVVVLVWVRHRDNILRLIAGSEPRL